MTHIFGDNTVRVEKRFLCLNKTDAMFCNVREIFHLVPFKTRTVFLHMGKMPYLYMVLKRKIGVGVRYS
jgi:hypothetical protein